MATHGRGTAGKRGIGGGGKTSTRSPGAAADGFKNKLSGNQGGNAGKADPGQGRNFKNMGSAGEKKTGPKFGKGDSKRTY